MHISRRFPPNYAAIAAHFDLVGQKPVFCWGDTIHNPHGIVLDAPLLAHERRHAAQQRGEGPAVWWGRYFADSDFRLGQEAEAYAAQLAAFRRTRRDRELGNRYLLALAGMLASPLYGGLCTRVEATALIRRHAEALAG